MKKWIAIICLLTLSLSLFVGCGQQEESGETEGTQETTLATTAPAEMTEQEAQQILRHSFPSASQN